MKLSGSTSKRESQILDVVYSQGSVTASQLEALLPGGPTNSAVRWHLRTLESKGFLSHRDVDGVFVYEPTEARDSVARGELSRLVSSFFGGSASSVLTMLLDQEREKLTPEDIQQMRKAIEEFDGGKK